VRLFCTIYDPRSGEYYFDYSIFIGFFIGFFILSSMLFILLRNLWRLWREERAGNLINKKKSKYS